MSILIETNLGDLVVDLDIQGSPHVCRNLLKLAKARYYTQTLIYNVQQGRFCQCGDQRGDGTGGTSIYGLLDTRLGGDVTRSSKRFIKSTGRFLNRAELRDKGRVVASEMQGVGDTIGSQFLITIDSGPGRALDGLVKVDDLEGDESMSPFLSLGRVVEDETNVLGKINEAYCDRDGRPYADIRIVRMFILDDPFEDLTGMDELLSQNGVQCMKEDEFEQQDNKVCARWLTCVSPNYDRPPGEAIEVRIRADQVNLNDEDEMISNRQNGIKEKEARSQAVILEMVGDLPSADIKPPENVLFVCKLNPVTEDEDLELIFSRFDPNARAEIIRDPDTGQSLQYAFIEFTTPEQCNEAYFKMNNTLIDDRRIKVDFSQSVAKIWNKYSQRRRGYDGEPNKQNHGNGRFHEQRLQNSQIDHSKRGSVVPKRQPPYYEKESDLRERPSRNEDSEHRHHHRHKREDRDRERKRSRSRDREYHNQSDRFHDNSMKTFSMSQNRESHAQVEKDHKHRSHHHKHEDPDRERKRRRSHQRRDYSDSDQSSDSRSHRRHKSHRKHKKKHKSRSRSRSRS